MRDLAAFVIGYIIHVNNKLKNQKYKTIWARGLQEK